MNFHYLLRETIVFFIVFLFFILPSLLVNQTTFVMEKWSFPAIQFSLAVSGLIICLVENKNLVSLKKSDRIKTFTNIGASLFSFGMLCVISCIFQLFAYYVIHFQEKYTIKAPSSILQYIFLVLTFLFSAFYEESLFRLYLPEVCSKISGKVKNTFASLAIAELIPALLFSFCHRYLGWLAVLNAFLCHFVLRFCYKKTENFLYGTVIHAIYNILNFAVLCYLN